MSASRHHHHRYHRHGDDRQTAAAGDDVDAILRSVIVRSGFLCEKLAEPSSLERRPSNGRNDTVDDEIEAIAQQCSTEWSGLADVATFEQLAVDWLPSAAMRRKLLDDIRVGDRLCASVARAKIVVLELTLLCTVERFRRCISVFMPNERFVVAYDRSKKVYQTGNYVFAYVTAIDATAGRLELAVREEEAILQSHQLPTYYRNYVVGCRHRQQQRQTNNNNDDDGSGAVSSDYDHNDTMRRLRGNANLAELLAVRIDVVGRSALRCFEGRALFHADVTSFASSACESHRTDSTAEGPQDSVEDEASAIRRRQNRRLAITQVERGAELTRAGRCFEAIQCFNRAINIDETCADAYVGRGAACAGSNNFPAALSDFEKALELDVEHRNAKRYRVEVLIAFGKSLEKNDQLSEAYEKFARAYEVSGRENERAAGALQRLAAYRPKAVKAPRIIELVDLATDEDDASVSAAKRRKFETSTAIPCSMLASSKVSVLEVSRLSADGGDESALRLAERRPSAVEDHGDFNETTEVAANRSTDVSALSIRDEEENRRKLLEMEAFIASLKS